MGRQASDFGPQTPDFGRQTSDLGLSKNFDKTLSVIRKFTADA